MFFLDPLGPGFDLGRLSFEQRDGFGESPLEMRVADFTACRLVLFAGRRVGRRRATDLHFDRQQPLCPTQWTQPIWTAVVRRAC